MMKKGKGKCRTARGSIHEVPDFAATDRTIRIEAEARREPLRITRAAARVKGNPAFSTKLTINFLVFSPGRQYLRVGSFRRLPGTNE